MGYNSGTGLVTGPIGIHDVQAALGVSGGGDLGTLCRSSAMNVFAKWKPFRHVAKFYGTDQERLTAAKVSNFGTGIVDCGSLTFAQKYTNLWTHVAPRGGGGGGGGIDEPYRLLDFNGYQSRKWQLGVTAQGRAIYTIFNGYMQIPGTLVSDLDMIYFNMQCRENEEIDADLNLLYPYDFAGCTKDISQYYVGIVILDHNGGVWVYSDPKVSDYYSGTLLYTGVRTQISNSIPNGALKIAPVLTQNRTLDTIQGGWTNNYNGDIIILNGAYLEATKVAQSANVKTDVTFNVGSSSITLNFSLTNQTGDVVTINNMYCYLLSDGAFMNEHDNGYSGPDYQGEGAVAYIMRTWPQNYKQGDIYSHDWNGGSTNPDQLAARAYNAYSDFLAANGGTNMIGNNTTRTWSKTFNFTHDDFGSYSNGAWALLCLAPTNNAFVREYSSY